MKVMLFFSGESETLPKAEVLSILASVNANYRTIYEKDRIFIFESDVDFPFNRLSMSKIACEFIDFSEIENLDYLAQEVAKKISGTFCVRSKSLKEKNNEIESKFGGLILKHNKNLKVDFSKPENTVMCIYNENIFVGLNKPIEKFFLRRPKKRAFFTPTTMSPKLSKCLVNLTRAKENDKILDPFCGSGGILIEAALMNMEIYGTDISYKMVEGSKKNLEFYPRKTIVRGNALDEKFDVKFDGIVTDLPYGRSSYTSDKDLNSLYEKFIVSAYNYLKNGKFLVMVFPEIYSPNIYKFNLIESHKVRVHKSLTRKIFVLRKN